MSIKHCWDWQNCQSRQRFKCTHTNIWNRCAINQLLNCTEFHCTHHQKTKVSPGWRAACTKGAWCKFCPADGTLPQAPSNSTTQHSTPNQLCAPRRLLLLGKHSRAQTKEDSRAAADLRKQNKGEGTRTSPNVRISFHLQHFCFVVAELNQGLLPSAQQSPSPTDGSQSHQRSAAATDTA